MRLKAINLIPKEVFKKPFYRQILISYIKNRALRNVTIVVFCIAAASGFQVFMVSGFEQNLSRAKRAMQEAKVKLNQQQSQYMNLEKIKSSLVKEELQKRQKLDLLLAASAQDIKYSQAITLIAELIPEDLWINNLVLSEGMVQITGSTLDNQLITQFMHKLDESKAFMGSRFTSSEKQVADSHTIYNFEITTLPLWNSQIASKSRK